uniref:response regulator n=1 Tax=Candidatus Magnetaquicoccus inordinatus TaxID=2496818 RepID=UPI00102B81C7
DPGRGSIFSFTLPIRCVEGWIEPALHANRQNDADIHKLRILLVEDYLDNQLLFKLYLKRTPHYLVIVNNGAEAVLRVQEEPFDLVLMDIQMPVMDGYEATRRIRQWEQQQQRKPLAIIALSAHASIGKQAESLSAGCNEHVNKPIKKQTLFQVLAKYARLYGEKPATTGIIPPNQEEK